MPVHHYGKVFLRLLNAIHIRIASLYLVSQLVFENLAFYDSFFMILDTLFQGGVLFYLEHIFKSILFVGSVINRSVSRVKAVP